MTAPDWRREGRGWPLAEHSRFVANGPLVWHVQRFGSGPTLLLIHGTGAATHSWRGLAPLLAEGFSIVAVDLPGHGFTRGRLPTGLALPGIARALGALCAAEGIAPVALIGHSAGAAIAVRMVMDGVVPAAAGSSPPVHVIALCPALRPFGGDAAGLMSGMARLMFANPAMPWLAAGLARFAVRTDSFLARSTGSRIDAEGAALYGRLFASPGHCAGAIGLMADWDLAPVAAALPRLGVPMTILHGARDAAVPLAEGRAAAAEAGAAFHPLAGLGHLAHEEDPAGVAAHIRAVLAGTATGAA